MSKTAPDKHDTFFFPAGAMKMNISHTYFADLAAEIEPPADGTLSRTML
jgi:hypothetical protein